MFLTEITTSDTIAALQKALAFTEARHKVLTENIANIDTPGYRTKQLDATAFQQALARALANHKENPSTPLELRPSAEFHEHPNGGLVVTPSEQPAENILFHDGTNGRVERQMAMLAENAMMHQTLTELLRGRYEGVLKAIRGGAGA
jgi:flagellar basal-body rod protein FlgB